LSRTKTPSKVRPSTARWGIVAAGAGASLGVFALLTRGSSAPPTAQAERRAIGAYQPERLEHAGRRHTAAGPGAAQEPEGELLPDLEARLRAAAHVEIVPARTPSGAAPPPPPAGPLPPEAEAQRQQALAGWQRQVQQQLDECVARPAALRQRVMLNVLFQPPPDGTGLAVQLLSPAAVSIPPAELRRLWRDTDPDGLQVCLDRVRALTLSVPVAPGASAQVLPTSAEPLLVQL
jgi:hypothetical protein